MRNLEEKGFDRNQLAEIQRALDAEQWDLYDVLAYIAFALPRPRARNEPTVRGPQSKRASGEKADGFLDFVLSQYVAEGYEQLDQDKLWPLLQLRYNSPQMPLLTSAHPPRFAESSPISSNISMINAP